MGCTSSKPPIKGKHWPHSQNEVFVLKNINVKNLGEPPAGLDSFSGNTYFNKQQEEDKKFAALKEEMKKKEEEEAAANMAAQKEEQKEENQIVPENIKVIQNLFLLYLSVRFFIKWTNYSISNQQQRLQAPFVPRPQSLQLYPWRKWFTVQLVS